MPKSSHPYRLCPSLCFENIDVSDHRPIRCYNALLRNDYRHFCKLLVLYLVGDVPNFQFHQSGACHEARLMADGLFILTLRLTQNITKLMDEGETNMMKKAALVVCLFYGPWFLKSYVVGKSSNNNLESFKQAFAIQKVCPDLSRALLASLQRHSWYLTEQLVVTALADDDVEECQGSDDGESSE